LFANSGTVSLIFSENSFGRQRLPRYRFWDYDFEVFFLFSSQEIFQLPYPIKEYKN